MDSPILRQFMVAVSPQLAAFSVGGAVTYPSLLMEDFRSNDSSIQLDVHSSSWIGSISGLAGIPVILMPIITQRFGRIFGHIMACLYVLIGWILTYTARNAREILISESFHGLGVNSLLPISFLGMSEMLASKYRFISMQAFGISQTVGMATCGILGRFFHYKTISIIMFVPIAFAVAIAFMWPESPSWFACKGEFEKCERAFKKLRGTDDLSAKELNVLITAQRENLSRKASNQMTLKDLCQNIKSRDFYIPSFHIFVLMNMLYWSGGDVIVIYFMELAKKSTTNEDAKFYAAIVMYLTLVIGMIVTDILVIRFNNKTVLLTSTIGVIICLSIVCIITGLQTLGILSRDSLLCVYCLLLCIASACLGLHSLVFNIAAELMPVRHRSLGGALYIVFNCLLYASSQKISPYLFLYVGMWGTFLIYVINACSCAVFVWKYVPETKGRSLQEIEDFYMYGRFKEREINATSVTLVIV